MKSALRRSSERKRPRIRTTEYSVKQTVGYMAPLMAPYRSKSHPKLASWQTRTLGQYVMEGQRVMAHRNVLFIVLWHPHQRVYSIFYYLASWPRLLHPSILQKISYILEVHCTSLYDTANPAVFIVIDCYCHSLVVPLLTPCRQYRSALTAMTTQYR